MKSPIDIVQHIYRALNVSAVTDEVAGGLHTYSADINETREHIVITSLPLSDNVDLQQGVANVNIFVPNINGHADTARLQAIGDEVNTALEAYSASNEYFSFHYGTQSLLPNSDKPELHLLNIRLNCFIQT